VNKGNAGVTEKRLQIGKAAEDIFSEPSAVADMGEVGKE